MTTTAHILGPNEFKANDATPLNLEGAMAFLNNRLADPALRQTHEEDLPGSFNFQFDAVLSYEDAQVLLQACQQTWPSAQVLYNSDNRQTFVHLDTQAGYPALNAYLSSKPHGVLML